MGQRADQERVDDHELCGHEREQGQGVRILRPDAGQGRERPHENDGESREIGHTAGQGEAEQIEGGIGGGGNDDPFRHGQPEQ